MEKKTLTDLGQSLSEIARSINLGASQEKAEEYVAAIDQLIEEGGLREFVTDLTSLFEDLEAAKETLDEESEDMAERKANIVSVESAVNDLVSFIEENA